MRYIVSRSSSKTRERIGGGAAEGILRSRAARRSHRLITSMLGKQGARLVGGKPYKLSEKRIRRCPFDGFMQSHKYSMAIETTVCVLRTVWTLGLLRDNFRSEYEPLRDPSL